MSNAFDDFMDSYRRRVVTDLQELLFYAMCILSNVSSYLTQDRSGAWEIVHGAQNKVIESLETVDCAARMPSVGAR